MFRIRIWMLDVKMNRKSENQVLSILVNQSLHNKKGSGKQVCRNLEANVSARARGKRE